MKLEMKRRILTGVVTAALVTTMAVPAYAVEPSVTSFTDVETTHWAYNDIMTIVNKGAISGTTTPVNGVGTYNPDGKVTLGQFLAIATRLVVPDILAKSEATSNHWASKNRNAAVESGFINRYAFLEEDLDAAISREDMAYILVNIAKANGEDLKKIEGIHNNISDYMIIAPIKRSAVLQAYSNGLLAGDQNSNFNPNDTVTRAQIAAVFCRLMNYVDRPSITVTNPSSSLSEQYFITDSTSENYGLIKSAYCKENAISFFNSARFTKNTSGQVQFSVTAPALPSEIISQGFKYKVVIETVNTNDIYINTTSLDLASGESKTITFEDTQNGGIITPSKIKRISFDVRLENTQGKFMQSYTSSSNWKTAMASQYYDSSDMKGIDYDAAPIYSGIGK